jgi:glutathione S-transferase
MLELVHRRTAGEDVSADEVERLGVLFGQAAAKIAREAARSTWLVGDSMTAADITNAAVLARVQRSGLFPLPKAVEECADWLGRVLAHDRVPS